TLLDAVLVVARHGRRRGQTEVLSRWLSSRRLEKPRPVRPYLPELRHRVAEIRLLHLPREKTLPLGVEASPRRRLVEPVSLIREQDLERIRIGSGAEPQEFCEIEDDGLGFESHCARRGRVPLESGTDRVPRGPVERALELLEVTEQRH